MPPLVGVAVNVTEVPEHIVIDGEVAILTEAEVLASVTVTVAEHVSVFPDVSVTVSVTDLVPISIQEKLLCDRAIFAIPQLSEEPLSISDVNSVAVPVEASNGIVIFLHTALGSILSSTVTVAVQVSVFPPESSAVSIILLLPRSAQVKLVFEIESETEPQSEKEPLSTSFELKVALPVLSR